MELIIFIFILFVLEYLLTGRYRATPNVPPEFDIHTYQKIDRIKAAFNAINNDKAAYLRSYKWQDKRKAVLIRDSYTCQKCTASGIPLDVHHLHYKNIGNEPLTDLVSLCRTCHDEVHKIYGYSPYREYPIKD